MHITSNNSNETKNSIKMLSYNRHEKIVMKRCFSFPKFSEIREIIEFGNAMEEINKENIISFTTSKKDKKYTSHNTSDNAIRRISYDFLIVCRF